MSDDVAAARVAGVGILTADPAAHRRLFVDALGFADVASGVLDDDLARHLGVAAGGTWTTYATAWTSTGAVTVVAPDDPGPPAARVEAAPFDVDAIKVLDLGVRDGTATLERLRDAGAHLPGTSARYPIAPGHGEVVERHAVGPDGIRFGLLEFIDEPRSAWCRAPDDADVTELLAVSLPVGDLTDATGVVTDGLGLPLDHEFVITEPSMREVAGVGPGGALVMRTFGGATVDTALAVVHYGRDPGTYRSLAADARPPNRGAVLVSVEVDDLDRVTGSLTSAGCSVTRSGVVAHPHGRREVARVQAPLGPLVELLGPLA